jgi:hypothetical protein
MVDGGVFFGRQENLVPCDETPYSLLFLATSGAVLGQPFLANNSRLFFPQKQTSFQFSSGLMLSFTSFLKPKKKKKN